MNDEDRNGLTEPGFYILMALFSGGKSKLEVLYDIYERSHGRVGVWPGALCTLLERFRECGMVCEAATGARGCVYALTERGRCAYQAGLLSLCACLDDALDAATYTTEHAGCERVAV